VAKKIDLRTKRIQRRWVLLAYLILGVEVVAVVITSPLLKPRLVVVENVRQQDVKRVSQVLKYTPYIPLLKLDRKSIQRHIQSDPHVERAYVRFGLPLTLRVTMAYRQPFIAVTDGTSAYLVDRQLVPFEQIQCNSILTAAPKITPTPQVLPITPVTNLPVVQKLPADLENLLPGCKVSFILQVLSPLQVQLGRPLVDANIRVGCEAITIIENEKFASQVHVVVDLEGNICLNIGSGALVRLGDRDQLSTKIANLKEMLRRSPSLCNDAEYIDLSEPKAPVWKPKSSAPKSLP